LILRPSLGLSDLGEMDHLNPTSSFEDQLILKKRIEFPEKLS
jgi:hypothetical protein